MTQIFTTKFSQLSGRFDPFFHRAEFKDIEKKIEESGWQTKTLGEIFYINRGGSPRPIQDFYTDEPDGINWIKIGDTEGVDKYIYTTKQKIRPDGAKKSRFVKEGDFILSNSMSFGKPFILKTEGLIHDGWLLFREKISGVNKDYLYSLLGSSFVYRLFKKSAIGGVVDNLNIDLVKKIRVPIPPTEVQNEIIQAIEQALISKKTKEKQAQDILDGIDNYLLGELKIDIGIKDYTSLKNRIFQRRLSDIVLNRCDPFYHQTRFLDNLSAISKSTYPIHNLEEIINGNFVKGTLPKESEKEGPCRVIQIKSINTDGIINLSELLTAQDIFTKHQKMQPGDIIVVITGATIGKIGLWDIPGDYYLGGDLVKFRTLENINPAFVYNYLRSSAIQTEIKRCVTGATNGHLSPNDIKKLPIPLPSFAKQTEIAEYITKLRAQAKKLQLEAQAELDSAKEKVEAIILGEIK